MVWAYKAQPSPQTTAIPMKTPSIKVNAVFNISYNLIRILFPLITFPYVTRVLGPVGIGVVAFAQSIATYFIKFSALGIPMYGTRTIARIRNDQHTIKRTFSELIVLGAGLSIIATVLYVLLYPVIDDSFPNIALYMSFGLMVLTGFATIDWYYQGMEDFRFITLRNLFIRALSVVAIFVFVRERDDYLLYGWIWIAGSVIASVINLGNGVRTSGFTFGSIRPMHHLPWVMPTFAISLASHLYAGIDTVMLGILSGDGGLQLGLYTMGNRVTKIVMTIVVALIAVVTPRVASLVGSGDQSKAKKLTDRTIQIVVFLSLPMAVGIALLASDIAVAFGGAEFRMAGIPMAILSGQLILISVGNVAANQALYAHGKAYTIAGSTVVAIVVAIGMNLVLIPRSGAEGAAVGTLVARLVEVAIQVGFGFFWLKSGLLNITNVKTLIAVGVMFGFLIFGMPPLSIETLSFRLIISTILGAGVFLLASAILKNEVLHSLWLGLRFRE